jgi:hypothetical protein
MGLGWAKKWQNEAGIFQLIFRVDEADKKHFFRQKFADEADNFEAFFHKFDRKCNVFGGKFKNFHKNSNILAEISKI